MTDAVWVDATKTRVVEEGSPEAAFRLHLRDAEALGIDVNPKVKMTPKPADKMRRRPADKGG